MVRQRKQKYDPRQITFTFDVMVDQIESIQRDNQEDQQEGKNARQTEKPAGNSKNSTSQPETIAELRNEGYSNSAYLILDRWALNSPERLRELEAKGSTALIV